MPCIIQMVKKIILNGEEKYMIQIILLEIVKMQQDQ